MSTDTIDLRQYRESPTVGDKEDDCKGCAFYNDMESCGIAIDTAQQVFGGDCVTNNVIYIQSETPK